MESESKQTIPAYTRTLSAVSPRSVTSRLSDDPAFNQPSHPTGLPSTATPIGTGYDQSTNNNGILGDETFEDEDPEVAFYRDLMIQEEERRRRRAARMNNT